MLAASLKGEPLVDISNPCQGLATTNNNRFTRQWFEVGIDRIGMGCTKSTAKNSVVIRDQDQEDCRKLKERLQSKCDVVKPGVFIRIACVELEAWYWGDPTAVSQAYGKKNFINLVKKATYRIPDFIQNPKLELRKHIPSYEPIAGSRKIDEYIDVNRNESHSFQVLIGTLNKINHDLEKPQ